MVFWWGLQSLFLLLLCLWSVFVGKLRQLGSYLTKTYISCKNWLTAGAPSAAYTGQSFAARRRAGIWQCVRSFLGWMCCPIPKFLAFAVTEDSPPSRIPAWWQQSLGPPSSPWSPSLSAPGAAGRESQQWMMHFVKGFCLRLLRWSCDVYSYAVHTVYFIYWSVYAELSIDPWDEKTWSWCRIFLIICCIVCKCLEEILYIYVH